MHGWTCQNILLHFVLFHRTADDDDYNDKEDDQFGGVQPEEICAHEAVCQLKVHTINKHHSRGCELKILPNYLRGSIKPPSLVSFTFHSLGADEEQLITDFWKLLSAAAPTSASTRKWIVSVV